MLQMRNPWEGDDGWKGDYSSTKGGPKYDQLKAALKLSQGGIKIENGKFWISFDDFVKEYSRVYIGHSQETRTPGGAERAEYRPAIDLNPAQTRHFARITLYDDLDLTKEILQLDNIQGGNRIGTVKNNAGVPHIDSGRSTYGLYPVADTYAGTEFRKVWSGFMADKLLWDIGQSGNWHSFTKADGNKIPKGEYILEVNNEWYTETNASPYSELKK